MSGNSSSLVGWGYWMRARLKVVGFKTQRELAKAICMKPESLSRMFSHPLPPRMEAKTIAGLSRALQVDQDTILHGWEHVHPSDLSVHLSPTSVDPSAFDSWITRFIMTATSLDEVVRFVTALRPELKPSSTAAEAA